MKQKAHIVTLIDLRNNGFSPKEVYCFSSREKAVAKMKELYEKELEKYGPNKPPYDLFHGDFSNPPFEPYAYCNETYIDYFKTEIQ